MKAVKEETPEILLSCIAIWNDLELFKVRNYYFTRMGMFAYTREDDKRMETKINQKSAGIVGSGGAAESLFAGDS